jgi:hypothetical protein
MSREIKIVLTLRPQFNPKRRGACSEACCRKPTGKGEKPQGVA